MRKRIRALFTAISAFLRSIRFRIALWFSLVLAVIMLAFSLFVYYRQSEDAYNQAAARLAIRIGELDRAFSNAFNNSEEGAWLRVPGTSSGNAFILREGEVIVLANQAGQTAAFFGPVNAADAEILAAVAQNQQPSGRLAAYQLKTGQPGGAATYLFISAPVGYKNRLVGWVILGQPLDPGDYLARLKVTLVLADLATLAAALALGYWLADRVLRPVKTITRAAQSISEMDLNQRLNIKSRDELGELAGTFDQMLDRLQAAFNRQRQFTADASHELRTPLAIIGLETGRALQNHRSAPEYRQALEVIASENAFMARLVEELLTLARMDSGQAQVQLEEVDLSDIALEVIERYEPIARQKGLRLEAGNLPELFVRADRQYLTQMVSNLVDNAIKYGQPGNPPSVQVETARWLDQDNHPFALLKVTDHGIGIAEEHLPHLFERFYRVDHARSHNHDEDSPQSNTPGSGLGLAIVHHIVQLLGGRIQVASQPRQGAAFCVYLPLSLQAAQAPLQPPE